MFRVLQKRLVLQFKIFAKFGSRNRGKTTVTKMQEFRQKIFYRNYSFKIRLYELRPVVTNSNLLILISREIIRPNIHKSESCYTYSARLSNLIRPQIRVKTILETAFSFNIIGKEPSRMQVILDHIIITTLPITNLMRFTQNHDQMEALVIRTMKITIFYFTAIKNHK